MQELNWSSITLVSKNEALSDVLDRHKAVFSQGLVTIKGFKADIKLQEGGQASVPQSLASTLSIVPKD